MARKKEDKKKQTRSPKVAKKATPVQKKSLSKPVAKKPERKGVATAEPAIRKKGEEAGAGIPPAKSERVDAAVRRAFEAVEDILRDETPPKVSIVIPVFNEETILASVIEELVHNLREQNFSFEIIIAENGSTDRTVTIAEELERRLKEVHMINVSEPNYGRALKQGILLARGEIVICDEIDLCDLDFYHRALALIDKEGTEFVVGSKLAEGAQDNRPMFRHVASHIINGMLRISVGFKGTDTHGLKAFVKKSIMPIVQQCIVENDLFASELVIRAERENLNIREIPVTIAEKRSPSINLARRVPSVLKNLVRLTAAIRWGKVI